MYHVFGTPAFQTHRVLVRRLLWLIVFLLARQAYAQTAGPEFPNPGNAHMSRDEQRALGLKAAAQVYQQMPVLPDNSPETQYIRQLGQKLAATIPPQYSWPFEFHVVAQKEINAFALPGGPMFVNIGTITAAANEAELAGVMGHEMSHVYMQHSAKQASKAQTTGLIAGLAGAALGATMGGTLGELGQMGLQIGAQGLMLKYSRSDEAQADAVGLALWQVPIPSPCSNQQYEAALGEAVTKAVAAGVTMLAFGDLFLDDIRRYREQQLAGTGLTPIFPLWGLPTGALARNMVAAGLRARLTCVDTKQLPASFAGREFDAAFLDELPAGVDPCGERGEFHTFAYAGPMFRYSLAVRGGEFVERVGFVFAYLF